MSEYKPIKMTVNHSNLPKEMLLFRDFEQLDDFAERFPGVDVRRLGRVALSLFRGNEDFPDASDLDYFGIGVRTENPGEVAWRLFFEHYAEMAYFSGLYFTKERKQMLHSMMRSNDWITFAQKFGWNPQVVINDLPSEAEIEAFAEWVLAKDPDLHHDLETAIRNDLEEA